MEQRRQTESTGGDEGSTAGDHMTVMTLILEK